ncbi:MAG: hypothetical protein ACTSO9_09090 [Candidatus Helarchaeota archaeon]
MRFFRRKKQKESEETVSPETNKMIETLQRQINNKDAQIISFQEDIAPNMRETIKVLNKEVESLRKQLKERDQELLNQQEMIRKISSGSSKLQREGATELLIKSQNEARLYKNQVLQQSQVIVELQKKVNLLPTICARLVEEINKRNTSIQALSNQVDKLKAENVKLSLDIIELEKRLEEVLKNFEEKEIQTRKLLSSVSI